VNEDHSDTAMPRYSEELQGQHVTLRRLRIDDVMERYLSFLRDPEVTHYIQARFIEHDETKLRAFAGNFDHCDRFLFGIFANDSEKFIGTCTLRVDPVHRFSSFGYMIGDKQYWGGPIALEFCHLMLDFAFFERGVRKILEPTTENHLASNFNFKRLGFTMVARIPDLFWGEGKYQAATYWTLSAADWAKKQGRPVPELAPPARD
jgi:[ribosomal protein S5]-alanine N-acetyltransferase